METTEQIENISCVEQGSFDWFRARLGHITSSMVYNVMLEPTKKESEEGELFSNTAKTYLYKVAAERNLMERIIKDDDLFSEYLERVNVNTRSMRYGTETEDIARRVYAIKTKSEVAECGFIVNTDIENYGDSPDGVVLDENGKPEGTLEIKCPNPETWMRYKHKFSRGQHLKDVEEKYYWQCQSHCLCNNVQWCDFVYFDKMQKGGCKIVRIYRNEDDISKLKQRIVLANEFIESLNR